ALTALTVTAPTLQGCTDPDSCLGLFGRRVIGVDMRPGVRTATLDGYLRLARSVGLDPARILAGAGLAVADLAVPDKWVPAAVVSRVLERSADESGLQD